MHSKKHILRYVILISSVSQYVLFVLPLYPALSIFPITDRLYNIYKSVLMIRLYK